MSGARVLIIEDEAMLRSSMVRGLSRLPGLEVVQAGTLGEGLALIDQATPALILSDIDLPDRSGLELIGEVGRRGLRTPIVFISAYLKAFRSQIPPHAYVEVLEKPVGIEELRDVVQRHVAVPAQSTGAGAPFGLADYMQLSSLGRHSVTIEVVGKGRVTIFQGQVWSAVDGKGDGTAALQRLLGDTSSQVVCQALKGEPGPRTLSGSAEEVLLEAARLMDEGQARRPQRVHRAGGRRPAAALTGAATRRVAFGAPGARPHLAELSLGPGRGRGGRARVRRRRGPLRNPVGKGPGGHLRQALPRGPRGL